MAQIREIKKRMVAVKTIQRITKTMQMIATAKFTAALQYAQIGAAPVLIRVDTKSGHGAGKPTRKQIEEAADLLAFLGFHTGMGL